MGTKYRFAIKNECNWIEINPEWSLKTTVSQEALLKPNMTSDKFTCSSWKETCWEVRQRCWDDEDLWGNIPDPKLSIVPAPASGVVYTDFNSAGAY